MKNLKETICFDIQREIDYAREDFEIITDFNSVAWSEQEHQAYIKGLTKALEIASLAKED